MSKKLVLALCALFVITATPALADDDRRGGGRHWHGDYDDDDRYWDRRAESKHHKYKKHHKYRKHHKYKKRYESKGHGHGGYRYGRHDYHGHAYGHRHAHNYRHDHGHGHGYGRFERREHRAVRRDRRDDWALYAILALQLVEVLNDSQRDSFASAQQRAATAPLGDTIIWNDGGARGSVVPTRDGSDANGRYCREFQQEVVVGNRRQSGYGIACRQPDGAWQIASN